jgi:hypothetical protein
MQVDQLLERRRLGIEVGWIAPSHRHHALYAPAVQMAVYELVPFGDAFARHFQLAQAVSFVNINARLVEDEVWLPDVEEVRQPASDW